MEKNHKLSSNASSKNSSQNQNSNQQEQLRDDGIPLPTGESNLIDTDYVVGQDNIKGSFTINLDLHGKVFLISSLSVIAFILITLMFPTQAAQVFSGMKNAMLEKLDWFFLASANFFLILSVAIILSPLGKVKLGGKDATPSYSYTAWLAMLFAAGMGIGLMFFGVGEPITHFTSSMDGTSIDAATGLRSDWAPLNGMAGDATQAKALGMGATIYHWGIHGWAIYAIIALGMALFAFNKGLPLTIRSIFYPIFGERIWGWTGHIIDILAVFSTIFGLAISLGLGAGQAASGLHYLFGISEGNTTRVVLIIAITAVALFSVVAGMDKGVKRMSELNMILALILLLFVIFTGSTLEVFKNIGITLTNYFKYMPELSNPFGREDTNFVQGWSAFYWAWYISWSPFVGMFIARVSRGRSVREFLIAVILVPTIITLVWMSSFGGTAVDLIIGGAKDIQDAALELKLFMLLDKLPLSTITSIVGIVLVIIFFVTSSDSGSLVIDSITADGKVNAPVAQRIFWTVALGLIAIALLLGGGLNSLQAMVITTGFPFTIIMLGISYSIIVGLIKEPR